MYTHRKIRTTCAHMHVHAHTHRVGVYDRRYTVVVEVTFAPHHSLHTNDSLVLCLVGQHWTMDTVTNRIDTRGSGLEREKEREREKKIKRRRVTEGGRDREKDREKEREREGVLIL